MLKFKEIMVIAPYWCDPQHLGHYRVERFTRWLSGVGMSITMVAAGNDEKCIDMPWGKLITVRDPLQIYGACKESAETAAESSNIPQARSNRNIAIKCRAALRWLSYAILNPDPGVLWANRVARSAIVIANANRVNALLSSSFPESAHCAAANLAARFQLPLLIDMRDGWLDEPMKPFLATSAFQRWRQARLEKRILRQASLITVTSQAWSKMLVARLPFVADKTVVVTNAYPLQCTAPIANEKGETRSLNLLYAGRIFTSRPERRIEHLMQPLLSGLQASGATGCLHFVGNFGQKELNGLQEWKQRYLQIGWEIKISGAVLRAKVLELTLEADGLVLLSSSQGSIPAKLFDYLCSRRPILGIAPENSAVAEIAVRLPQVFSVDCHAAEQGVGEIQKFVEACRRGAIYDLPIEFSDAYTCRLYLDALDTTTRGLS